MAGERWPLYTPRRGEYKELNVGPEPPEPGSGPRSEKCAFWLHYLPDLRRKRRFRPASFGCCVPTSGVSWASTSCLTHADGLSPRTPLTVEKLRKPCSAASCALCWRHRTQALLVTLAAPLVAAGLLRRLAGVGKRH